MPRVSLDIFSFKLGRSACDLFHHSCFATAQGGLVRVPKSSLTVTPRKPPLMDALQDLKV